MTTALVLSGGGAKGAFQVAAERVLREEAGYDWDVVAGVSVGALNAAMIAQKESDLLYKVWESLGADDVHVGGLNLWTAIKLLFGKRSIYDNRPLLNLIREHVHPEEMKIPMYVGAVDMHTGRYFRTPPDNMDPEIFHKFVWASASMPIIWEPKGLGSLALTDGGLRNISPLGDVIDHDPDEIVIINASPRALDASKKLGNIVDVARRTLDVMLNELFVNDIREFLRINRLVEQAEDHGVSLFHESGRAFRKFDYLLVEPDVALGDSLDFSREVYKYRKHAGIVSARQALRRRARA